MVMIEHDTSGSRVEDCLARGLNRGFNNSRLGAMVEKVIEGT